MTPDGNFIQPQEIRLFLVHGTFAPRSPWIQQDSPFCSYMREHLPKLTLLETVDWSGANTTEAREEGVMDLSKKLSRSIQENPDAKHVVVGHSHGGTIALNAVSRDPAFTHVSVATCRLLFSFRESDSSPRFS